MNRIENEWQLLLSFELGGRMFEDEYDAGYGCDSRCGVSRVNREDTARSGLSLTPPKIPVLAIA